MALSKLINPKVFMGASNPWSGYDVADTEVGPAPDISSHPDMSPGGTLSSAITPSKPSIQGTKEFADYQDLGAKLKDALTPQPISTGRALLGALVGARNPVLGNIITGQFQRQRQIQPLMQQYQIAGDQINRERQLELEQANLSKMNAETDLANKHGAYFDTMANAKENPVDKLIDKGFDKDGNAIGVFQRPDNTTYQKSLTGIVSPQSQKPPTAKDQDIQDILDSNRWDDTPANRVKARNIIAQRSKSPQDEETKDLKKQLLQAQVEKSKEPTPDEQRRDDLARNLDENLTTLEDIAKRRPELFGPAAGRLTGLRQAVGTNDPDVAALKNVEEQMGLAMVGAHAMRNAQHAEKAAQSITGAQHTTADALLAPNGPIATARKSVQTFRDDAQRRRKAVEGGSAPVATDSKDPLGIL